MRTSTVVAFSAFLAMAGLGGTALAAYNTPAKAKGIKTDLVVAYDCLAPNATQFFAGAGIIASCTPPFPTTMINPANVTEFGPKGKASVNVSVTKGDLKVLVKAIDVLNNGVAANGVNLGTRANRVITTSGNCAPGLPPQPLPIPGTECTSTDIGALFGSIFSIPCSSGKCQLKTTVNTIVPGALSAGGLVNTEIGGIGITDPDGDLAFTSGLFIP